MVMSFREWLADEPPFIENVYIVSDEENYELYEDRKWVKGRFENNIGLDQPTHGRGQQHAHVLGRKGDEILAVNRDGSSSHGKPGKLHKKDAEALRARGFDIPSNNIVEWILLPEKQQLLFG